MTVTGTPMYSRYHEGTLCTVFLVAWKEGWVIEVRHTLDAIQTPNSFYFLASYRPAPKRVCVGPIRRDHLADLAAQAGAGAVPTEAH